MENPILVKLDEFKTLHTENLNLIKAEVKSVKDFALKAKETNDDLSKVITDLKEESKSFSEKLTSFETVITQPGFAGGNKSNKLDNVEDFLSKALFEIAKNPSKAELVKSDSEYKNALITHCDVVTECYKKQYEEIFKNKPIDKFNYVKQLKEVKSFYDSRVETDGGIFLPPAATTAVMDQVYRTTELLQYVPSQVTSEDTVKHVVVEGHAEFEKVFDLEKEHIGNSKKVSFNSELLSLQLHQSTIGVETKMLENRNRFEIDVVGKILNSFAVGYGLLKEQYILLGSGQNEPRGIIGLGSDGTPAIKKYLINRPDSYVRGQIGYLETVNTGELKPVDIIQFLTKSILTQFKRNAVLVMNSNTKAYIESLEDANGDPILFNRQSPLGQSEVDKIRNYKVIISENMPDIASGNYPILFGDLSELYTIYENPALQIKIIGNQSNTKFASTIQAYTSISGGAKNYQAGRLLKIK